MQGMHCTRLLAYILFNPRKNPVRQVFNLHFTDEKWRFK